MSQQNVEIVRALFEVWNAADMDAFSELYDPDVIVRTVKDWPEPGPHVGREAVMRFHEQLRDTWDVNTLVPIGDFIDAGDRVAVRYIWRGAGHGPDLNMELTLVFTMRKGKIVFQEFFWDHAEALEAVGLRSRPMSQENVKLVEAALNAFRRDGLTAFAEYWTEDVDYRPVEGAIDDRGPMRGKAAVRAYVQDWLETFDEFRSEPVELIDAGENTVVAVLTISGRARLSGVETDLTYAVVYTIRNGKIARGREYATRDEALQAAGLSE